MSDKYINDFIEEIKPELCEHEYKNFLNSEEMSWKIFELLQSQDIHCRIVGYPLQDFDENNVPTYMNELEEYPQIDLLYNYNNDIEEKAQIVLINDVEDFELKIDENYVLYIDSNSKKNLLDNFTIENGNLIYDLGNMKNLHYSILIKYSTGWKDFDYTGMDIFYYPIYSKTKINKYIIQEYDPNVN